ncbi:MAG TPA: hypothetical protein DIC42_07150 [Holosporales bacterium]|nr:hypothetical protein [Holosporales bacterium]
MKKRIICAVLLSNATLCATENTPNGLAGGDLKPVPNLVFSNPNSLEAQQNRAAGDAYLAQQRAREIEAARARGDEAMLQQMADTDRIMAELERGWANQRNQGRRR